MSAQKGTLDDDNNLRTLRELLAFGSNRTCFDCGQRGPTYVNTTVGSFVCTTCSGKLRGITPPHRIKSISMATFTSDEMDFIRCRGNDFCRKVWLGKRESSVQSEPSGAEEGQPADELTQKYEKKQWYVAPTEEMYEEARRTNASLPVKKTEATLISQACQITTSRSIPNISTQSIQRPTPGNVRSLPGTSPQVNPTISSLPQSPVKFSPQTPKSTVVPSVWGVQDPPPTFQTGIANFADFSSFDSATQPHHGSFFTGFASGTQPFFSHPSSTTELFLSTGGSYKPPVPFDRYAALAELDSARGSDFFNCNTGVNDRGVQNQHVSPSLVTNPFISAASTGSTGVPFSPPGGTLSSPFLPMNAFSSSSHPTNTHPPCFGTSPQSGGNWNGNSHAFSHGGQPFPAAGASNPFLNMPKQNVTNPFL